MGDLYTSRDTCMKPGDTASLHKLTIGEDIENSCTVIMSGKVILHYTLKSTKKIKGVQNICIEKGELVNLSFKNQGITIYPSNTTRSVAIDNLRQAYSQTCS